MNVVQDRFGSQDPTQLMAGAAGLALITAASRTGYSYNFALLLFGIVSYEMRTSVQPFRHFVLLCLTSLVFDLYTIIFNLSGLILLVSVLLFLVKIPLGFSSLAQLRERGSDINFGPVGDFGARWGAQAPNWAPSMPGGFTQQPAAETQAQRQAQPQPQAEPQFPSSGGFKLGGDDDDAAPPPGRGGYSSIA